MSTALVTFHLKLQHRLVSERGATMVEYGLMVAVIAMVVVVAAATLGGDISALFGNVSNKVSTTP